ncbi:HAMP domain-containing sensor histidine kinase [Flavobacterium sp. SUN052]|uniref:sensor histidine kinase n=1 Tax=Flavobacterium sp. SUN052 TaxID=3002441 RepID=UPI00237D6EC2|nr:HAMP domain-containing sensor histidine kinase [Flavobacterium sp. SUN052]MEC4005081.1 HAMP domain-containing sensor histidine kinase [Flavobacterium sp. SUN052]
MNKFSLKNRIAFYYIISAAMLIFVVFFSIYTIVSLTVFNNVNNEINSEIKENIERIKISENAIQLTDKDDWMQGEHNEVSVDPIFLQLTNSVGTIIEKSENLKKHTLIFNYKVLKNKETNFKLSGKYVRQIQVPLFFKNKISGYLIVAVSLGEAINVVDNLKNILFILFPIVLLLLFFVAQFIAGRSIKPINSIITTSNAITNDNLKSRIELPKNKDELFILSQTINNLLDRIEATIDREKQFTSDASHELRTPLAVIKGTLEVLIRKPRNTEEYQQKINLCISEVDRINNLVDQLLLLARFENQKQSLNIEKICLNDCIKDAIKRFENKANKRNLTLIENYSNDYFVETDIYFFSIILNNLISNALKYSKDNGRVEVVIEKIKSTTILKVVDNGIGIAPNELDKVFNSFYRTSNSTNYPEIKGTGLGLSIAKRLCAILLIEIEIFSEQNNGTTLKLSILDKF